jgi:hypothetical protein
MIQYSPLSLTVCILLLSDPQLVTLSPPTHCTVQGRYCAISASLVFDFLTLFCDLTVSSASGELTVSEFYVVGTRCTRSPDLLQMLLC